MRKVSNDNLHNILTNIMTMIHVMVKAKHIYHYVASYSISSNLKIFCIKGTCQIKNDKDIKQS